MLLETTDLSTNAWKNLSADKLLTMYNEYVAVRAFSPTVAAKATGQGTATLVLERMPLKEDFIETFHDGEFLDIERQHGSDAALRKASEKYPYVAGMMYANDSSYVATEPVKGSGHVVLVRCKISTSSEKLSGKLPNKGTTPEVSEMLHKFDDIASGLWILMSECSFYQKLIGIPTCSYSYGDDGPKIIYRCEDPEDKDRITVVTMQTTVTDFYKGSQKRSALEQAYLEGLSFIRKQLTRGASLLYEKTGEYRPGALFPVIYKNDTDTSTLSPMLAHDGKNITDAIKTVSKAYDGAFMQPKYDGVRYMVYMDEGTIVMKSKGGLSNPIIKLFAAEFKKAFDAFGPTAMFDGELYVHTVPENVLLAISGLPYTGDVMDGPEVRVECGKISGAATSCIKQGSAYTRNLPLINLLEFRVFTYVDLQHDRNAGHLKRYEALLNFFQTDSLTDEHSRRKITLAPISTDPDFYELVTDLGYEGAMVYGNNAPYTPGRTKSLLKVKSTETEWVQIVGVVSEAGLPMANLKYRYGNSEHVSSGCFTEENKRLFYERPELFVDKTWALIRFQKVNTTSKGGAALRDPKIKFLSYEKEGEPINLSSF